MLQSLTNKKIQAADGVAVTFTYDFLVINSSHIVCYSNGDMDAPITPTGFTGIGDQGGGTVTLASAPAVGTLTIVREVPLTQLYDYIVGGKFPSEMHEQLADVMMMAAQWMAEISSRAVNLPIDSVLTAPVIIEAPVSGKSLIYDADGNIVNGATADEIADAQAYAAAAGIYAAAAATSESNAAISETNAAASAAASNNVYKADGAGTVDVITAVLGLTSIPDGTLAAIRASGAITVTTPTFNPDGLGANTIVREGGQVLLIDDVPRAGYEMFLKYNLANTQWELLNPAAAGIVDSGSNANGEYIKYADGTLICNGEFTLAFSAAYQTGVDITMPATFIDNTYGVAWMPYDNDSAAYHYFLTLAPAGPPGLKTATTCNMWAREYLGSVVTLNLYCSFVAIGRWK